jgi:hypothetical protein
VIVTWGAVSGISASTGVYVLYEDSAGTQQKVGGYDDRRVARDVEWYQDTVAVRLRFGVATALHNDPDTESTIRWSGYVTVPAKPSTTTVTTPTPRPTGVTAVAGWSWDSDGSTYTRGIRVQWNRVAGLGCANYELQGRESSATDFVVLGDGSRCGGAHTFTVDIKYGANASLLKAGTSYRFKVVAEYVGIPPVRMESTTVSRTTCSSSTSVPAANQGGMGNPFRNCNGTVR